MTKQQLFELRSEITLNSLYISDYENSLNIDPHTVCDFFDGFMEHLDYISTSEHGKIPDKNYYNIIFKYDTPDRLWEYYQYYCEVDPLPLPTDDTSH